MSLSRHTVAPECVPVVGGQCEAVQARRNDFRSGAAERSEYSERSELRAERVITAGGLGGAGSDSPGNFLKFQCNFEQFEGTWRVLSTINHHMFSTMKFYTDTKGP